MNQFGKHREHTNDSASLRYFQSHRLIISFHNSFTSSSVSGTLHCTKWWRLNLRGLSWKRARVLRVSCVGLLFSLGSRRSCSRLRRRRLIITTHHSSTYHITTSHHDSSQLITTYHIPTHHSSTSHTSLITAPLLITTHHSSTSDRSTSHHNSSQLITSQLITVPLLTPHLSHHNFSSQLITSQLITAPLLTPLLTPHLSHQNSSQLHFSHLTSQVHFSHLTSHTSPKFTLSLAT